MPKRDIRRTCVHVGAHHAQEEYPGYDRVYWVEADPKQWERLRKEPYAGCFAAMDYDGTVELQRRNVSMASSILPLHPDERDFEGAPLKIAETVRVPCYKLDTIYHPLAHVHLLVIDVEGAELHVLRGAIELLKRTDEVKIELLPRPGYPTEIEYSELLHEFELMEKCPYHGGDWYDLRYRRAGLLW